MVTAGLHGRHSVGANLGRGSHTWLEPPARRVSTYRDSKWAPPMPLVSKLVLGAEKGGGPRPDLSKLNHALVGPAPRGGRLRGRSAAVAPTTGRDSATTVWQSGLPARHKLTIFRTQLRESLSFAFDGHSDEHPDWRAPRELSAHQGTRPSRAYGCVVLAIVGTGRGLHRRCRCAPLWPPVDTPRSIGAPNPPPPPADWP